MSRWGSAVALVWAAIAPASAHHSALMFDRESVVAFQGAVTRYEWTNPHVYIYVETEDATGETVEWEIETDATPILTRSGWTAETFAPGDLVSVRANPERGSVRRHALLVSIGREDGAVFTARSDFLSRADAGETGQRATDLAGKWELGLADYRAFVASWRAVPLTEEARIAQAAYDVKTDSPEAECIALPSPGILAAPYLNEIEILDDRVLLRNERFNVERVVYTDGRDHPSDGEPLNQGHSIGRWDGDALVVDTVLFAEHRSQLLSSGIPSGIDKHVVERFALSDDGRRIRVDFRLQDPEYFAAPFEGSLEWFYSPHLDTLSFDCDPEISSRFAR